MSVRQAEVWPAVGVIALATAVYAPILYYMVLHWKQVDDYSHGFIVVPLALYFAWQRKPALRAAPIRGTWWGLFPLALGLLALIIGTSTEWPA